MNYLKTHSLLDKKERNVIKPDPNLSKIVKCNPLTNIIALVISDKVPTEEALKEYLNSFNNSLRVEIKNNEVVTKEFLLELKEEPLITLTAQRASSKKVTLIWGIEKMKLEQEKFLKLLKEKLATSGTVHDSKIYPAKEILIQGKHLEGVKQLLMKNFNLPEKQIKLIDKIGDPKKKKKKH